MKKASRAKTTIKKGKKAMLEFADAVNRAMKNPANRSWNKPYNSNYVMAGGIPHKIVDGKFVPYTNLVEVLAKKIRAVSKKKSKRSSK